MTRGIPESNYCPIPNIVFDYWMSILTHAEFKVLCAICRKTFGWRKGEDYISIKQIEILTGVSRRSIQDCIHVLENHGLIEIIQSKTRDGDCAPNLYRINVLENQEEIDGGSATIAPRHATIAEGSAISTQGVVQPLHPQYTPIQKKENERYVVVPSFIQEIEGITEQDKKILSRYDPVKVKAAIEYNKHVPPIGTKIQQLMFFSGLDKPVEIRKKDSQLHDELSSWSDQNKSDTCTMVIQKDCVIFDHQGQARDRPIIKFSNGNAREEIKRFTKLYKFYKIKG